MTPPPPPLLPEDIWEEILLRIPPDNPASLLRATLACKALRRIASRRGFLRRLRELHGAPPILGFFQNYYLNHGFVPTAAGSAFSLPIPNRISWPLFFDCRHGRVLRSTFAISAKDMLIWEPITGYQRRVPFPTSVKVRYFNAAVFCAVDGCYHSDCHGGPFRVVFVSSDGDDSVSSACEYSSETGAWGEPIPAIHQSHHSSVTMKGSLLLGKFLYFLCGFCEILEYDLDEQRLTVIDPTCAFGHCGKSLVLMRAEDGGLGVASIVESRLLIWSRKRSDDGDGDDNDAGWVLRRTIHLENLLPAVAALPEVCAVGLVESANVILLSRSDGVFTVELNSGRAGSHMHLLCSHSSASTLPVYKPMPENRAR